MKRHLLFKIAIQTILVVVATLIALVLWHVYEMNQDEYKRCANLRNSLFAKIDQAKEVQVIEHSNRWDDANNPGMDNPEKIYATVVLNTPQVAQLKAAMFSSEDRSANTVHSCIFEPHHRIKITNPDNSVSTLEICFVCGEWDVNGRKRILPDGWDKSLKVFISSLSMRPDGPWRLDESHDSSK